MKKFTEDELLAVQAKNEPWLLAQRGVTGTSVGLGPGGDLVFRIFTCGATPATRGDIAQKLSGIPLAWEEGEIVAD